MKKGGLALKDMVKSQPRGEASTEAEGVADTRKEKVNKLVCLLVRMRAKGLHGRGLRDRGLCDRGVGK